MRKAALPAAANRFRRRYHCGSSALPLPSAASRSPLFITSDILIYHGGAFGKVLSIPRYSLAFLPSHFFTSSHRSTSHDPRFTGTDTEEEYSGVEWEEEEDREPVIGDGGDGGGVVLGDVKWGEHALSLAREVLLSRFGDDIALYAFKVSPKGYIYVRLDKITSRFGCPGMEEMEGFNLLYKERLDKVGEAGAMPANMAVEAKTHDVAVIFTIHILFFFLCKSFAGIISGSGEAPESAPGLGPLQRYGNAGPLHGRREPTAVGKSARTRIRGQRALCIQACRCEGESRRGRQRQAAEQEDERLEAHPPIQSHSPNKPLLRFQDLINPSVCRTMGPAISSLYFYGVFFLFEEVESYKPNLWPILINI